MIFGKIDYLNLLPFHIFMKRYAKSSRHLHTINYKKGVPSKINSDFKARRVDAAFISSIEARGYKRSALGIVAKKEVQSVLLIPQEQSVKDSASASSNALAKVLGLQGEVLIGDRALRAYLEGIDAVDLAKEWHRRYQLPFVFALLCYHNHDRVIANIEKLFVQKKIYIPQYLLEKAAIESRVSKKDILEYLQRISYIIDTKSLRGLKKFYRLVK